MDRRAYLLYEPLRLEDGLEQLGDSLNSSAPSVIQRHPDVRIRVVLRDMFERDSYVVKLKSNNGREELADAVSTLVERAGPPSYVMPFSDYEMVEEGLGKQDFELRRSIRTLYVGKHVFRKPISRLSTTGT